MNPGAVRNSILRFVVLLIVQVFLLDQIHWGWGGKEYLYILIYPLFVALFPLTAPRPAVIFTAFLLGLGVDFFVESLGVHAGALCFTAYARPLILKINEPLRGYNIKDNPSTQDLGFGWMARYLATIYLFHCLALFLFQTFSLFYIPDILLKTLFSWPVSTIVALAVVLITKPSA